MIVNTDLQQNESLLRSANILGAIVAHIIYVSSILTFVTRIIYGVGPGYWIGIPLLLTVFPLVYLIIIAPRLHRPVLYYIQVGLMILFILVLFVLDYVLQIDFRQDLSLVIGFVVLYFAGMGGMLGVASLAGRGWMISGIIFFLASAILAFVQRSITGF
jgi:hypothetical protein